MPGFGLRLDGVGTGRVFSFLLLFFFYATLIFAVPFSGIADSSCDPLLLLSQNEQSQLGRRRARGHDRYPTASQWLRIRKMLVDQSLESNALLDVSLTAYTPGETLSLLKNPRIQEWLDRFSQFRVPEEYDVIALVPCAKTKPWANADRGLYRSYNQLRKDVRHGLLPKVYFVTLSEPLGIVPEEFWDDFPQYDVPGLFASNARRTSLLTRQWQASPFKKVMVTPYDPKAYQDVIHILAEVIARFLKLNSDRVFLSFVEDHSEKSTHSDMLDEATVLAPGILHPENRFWKRGQPRQAPYPYIRDILLALPSSSD